MGGWDNVGRHINCHAKSVVNDPTRPPPLSNLPRRLAGLPGQRGVRPRASHLDFRRGTPGRRSVDDHAARQVSILPSRDRVSVKHRPSLPARAEPGDFSGKFYEHQMASFHRPGLITLDPRSLRQRRQCRSPMPKVSGTFLAWPDVLGRACGVAEATTGTPVASGSRVRCGRLGLAGNQADGVLASRGIPPGLSSTSKP